MQRTMIPDAEIQKTDPETLIYCFTPWVQKIASRYTALLAKTGAVDMNDLYQVGCMALLNAQKLYNPEAGASFLGFSQNYIRNAMRKELGFSPDGRQPVIMEYLDEPLKDDEDTCKVDMLMDESIEPADERIQRLERYDELHRAIGRLESDKHREIIKRVYFDEETPQQAAASMGMKVGSFYSANQIALGKQRRDYKLKMLCAPVYSPSLRTFRLTFTSAVEAEVLWKEATTDKLLGQGTYLKMHA